MAASRYSLRFHRETAAQEQASVLHPVITEFLGILGIFERLVLCAHSKEHAGQFLILSSVDGKPQSMNDYQLICRDICRSHSINMLLCRSNLYDIEVKPASVLEITRLRDEMGEEAGPTEPNVPGLGVT